MDKKAIDIVLLPPTDIMDWCISYNNRAYEKGNASVKLNNHDFLPHLSLFMASVTDSQLSDVIQAIDALGKKHHTIPLNITAVAPWSFDLENTAELQQLHSDVAKVLESLVTHDIADAYYYESDVAYITDDCYPWVKNFYTHHSFEHFAPHITVGKIDASDIQIPVSFTANRLAICHLGKSNTCRNILHEITLS